ncbi:P2Y purinoceptor 1-like isoform X3 [Triplophysa dalaica]|uniref:P2Y purinoceptor 1-like isoform X3 n=1 Tax=Triplophysa dalaica TaxID=1582913 RepID=UPI0024E025FC|nr:P2Y purinoceptor 1-like isoform X3 [Triplophysa dalaica]
MDNISAPNLNSSISGPLPWYRYEVCAAVPYGFVFYFGVKVLNLAVGFPTNALVIWQIMKKKSEGSTSDIFIFNLSILDAYFCLMTPVDMVNRLYLNNENVWHFQHFAYGLKDMAPLFLTCICLDRKSVAGKETTNPVKKKAFKMVSTVLAIIVVNYLPPVALMPFASTYTFVDLRCKISVSVYAIMDLSSTLEPLLYVSKRERSALCCCPQSPPAKPIHVSV